MTINNIYRVQYLKDRFTYMGTCRNEKVFKIGDVIWFSPSAYQGEIAKGLIRGIELPPDENPEYVYKIEIPQDYVDDRNFSKQKGEFENIKCDSMFSTLEEAKESAIKRCDYNYKAQKEEIERYFAQFEKPKKL